MKDTKSKFEKDLKLIRKKYGNNHILIHEFIEASLHCDGVAINVTRHREILFL